MCVCVCVCVCVCGMCVCVCVCIYIGGEREPVGGLPAYAGADPRLHRSLPICAAGNNLKKNNKK
jgi:hypothetical protein